MTFLYRILSDYCGYHTNDITIASYIHTEVNTDKASSDTGYN